jgi:hypothetical protein
MRLMPWFGRHGAAASCAALLIPALGAFDARAECPAPSGPGFSAAARAEFECSSSRLLKDPPPGAREFQVVLDFPSAMPDTRNLPWREIDFRQYPEAYLRALLGYGIRDNSDAAIDWRIEDNQASRWCHAPWFHNQRERLRGMTLERGSRPRELHDLQVTFVRNWAVGFYNDVGCFALGRVWADPASPKTRNFIFPVGAYSIKLLFTTATPAQVPYLSGSKEWLAAIENDGGVVPMRLLQVDVAVRDARADSLAGWVFGTFMYNESAPGGTVWEKLVPVGLMWGNDPELTTIAYEQRGRIAQESWINPAVAAKFYHLPRHNLGLHGRLNGPVDNFRSACLACHGRALDWGRAVPRNTPVTEEADLLLPIAPAPHDEEAVRRYFRNLGPTQPFVAGTQSLDFSLQLAGGIGNFRNWIARRFPAEAANASDVEPYVFEVERTAPPDSPAVTDPLAGAPAELLLMLERSAADRPRSSESGPFVRGEE